jgi:hypothetical protein
MYEYIYEIVVHTYGGLYIRIYIYMYIIAYILIFLHTLIIYIYIYIYILIYTQIVNTNMTTGMILRLVGLQSFMGGMFWLFIVGLFCYICIFYYSYVDSLTYAFGWSAFLCIRFCGTLVVIFFK